jgi:hypothetical protein
MQSLLQPGRFRGERAEDGFMPDLAAMLMRRSLGALGSTGTCCGSCGRTPLAGETLHELETGRRLCELCFGALPEHRRQAVNSVRVGASERRLEVVPKAA